MDKIKNDMMSRRNRINSKLVREVSPVGGYCRWAKGWQTPKYGRMFGLVWLGHIWLFGRSSAELRQTFGVIYGFAPAVFCARCWR